MIILLKIKQQPTYIITKITYFFKKLSEIILKNQSSPLNTRSAGRD